MAIQNLPDGLRFREELAISRRAFAFVGNSQVLSRAIISRSRPGRGYDMEETGRGRRTVGHHGSGEPSTGSEETASPNPNIEKADQPDTQNPEELEITPPSVNGIEPEAEPQTQSIHHQPIRQNLWWEWETRMIIIERP